MKLSDALSRQSSHNTDNGNCCDVKCLNMSVHEIDVDVSGCKLNITHEENKKDDTIWFLIKHILECWPGSQDKSPDSIKEFYSFHYFVGNYIDLKVCHPNVSHRNLEAKLFPPICNIPNVVKSDTLTSTSAKKSNVNKYVTVTRFGCTVKPPNRFKFW